MTLDSLQPREIDGCRWYLAQDVARLYKRPKVRDVTKLCEPEQKRERITNPTDWKFRKRELYISEDALLVVARHYSAIPLHEVRARLARV